MDEGEGKSSASQKTSPTEAAEYIGDGLGQVELGDMGSGNNINNEAPNGENEENEETKDANETKANSKPESEAVSIGHTNAADSDKTPKQTGGKSKMIIVHDSMLPPFLKQEQSTETIVLKSPPAMPIPLSSGNTTAAQPTGIGISTPFLKPAPSPPTKKRRKPPLADPSSKAGRWTDEEHQAFLTGLAIYGREWKKVAERIPTRTSAQVRSHAQKYFAKVSRQHEEQGLVDLEPAPSASSWDGPQSPSESASLPVGSETPPSTHLSASAKAEAARIMAAPERVEQEVNQTLERLHERYRHLQQLLQQRRQQEQHQSAEVPEANPNVASAGERECGVARAVRPSDESAADDDSSMMATTSVHSEQELIALHVLQGRLAAAGPHGGNASLSEATTATTTLGEDEDEKNDDNGTEGSSLKKWKG